MRYKLFFGATLLLLSMTAAGMAQDSAAYPSNRAKLLSPGGSVETKKIKFHPVKSSEVSRDINVSGAVHIRIHFKVGPAKPSSDWTINIFDKNNKLVWAYTATAEATVKELWTDAIKGNEFTVTLKTAPGNSLQLEIDKIIKITVEAIPLSVVGDTNFDPITTAGTTVKNWGKSVARIHFISESDSQPHYCTGFIVGPDLLMTNNHCISTPTEAGTAQVWFDYDVDENSIVSVGVKELLISSCDYDFSLLKLTQPVASPSRAPLQLSTLAFNNNAKLIVIQHPGGETKKVSAIDCTVKNLNMSGNTISPTDFGHTCDTYKSSSGSPMQVFEAGSLNGKVIGIHHLGWKTEELSPDDPRAINRAVKMSEIIGFIRRNKPELLIGLNIQ